MSLPTYKDDNKNLMLMQSQWSSQLNPVLSNPMTNPTFVKNYALVTGVNVINHKLGMTPVGWIQTDINAAITLYRSQPFNPLTLTLTSSGPAVISLAVF
jgi:hypothetical protein